MNQYEKFQSMFSDSLDELEKTFNEKQTTMSSQDFDKYVDSFWKSYHLLNQTTYNIT